MTQYVQLYLSVVKFRDKEKPCKNGISDTAIALGGSSTQTPPE